jgi:hypothetical protein
MRGLKAEMEWLAGLNQPVMVLDMNAPTATLAAQVLAL